MDIEDNLVVFRDPETIIDEAFGDIDHYDDRRPTKVPFARSPLPAVRVDDIQAAVSIVSKLS